GIRLTEWTSCGGCAAKWEPAQLGGLLESVGPDQGFADLLIGISPFDDAAVYRLSDDLALVSTTDFFPPLVDDPADFGAIAAANACSDVFAMGGDVRLALNLAAFPEQLPLDVIGAILAAAARVVDAAGGVVAGGHTIRSEEPIFGLAVQGVVRPHAIFTKGGARVGDRLVISKPLGTGIALASKDPVVIAGATAGMRSLNRDAADTLREHREDVHAVTDVTGFGLAGHAWEMAQRSGTRMVITGPRLPLYDGVAEAAERGIRTGGNARNRRYLDGRVDVAVDEAVETIAFDPQTSGGLLAAVAPEAVDALEAAGFVAIGAACSGAPAVVLQD
ncbi:MAG: selenide, water dikinase SelD, partial [Acidimicrobiia bacterium]